MRLTKIETFSIPEIGFVRVTDEMGNEGLGQVSTYQSDITSQVLHRQVVPHVLGVEFDPVTSQDDLFDRAWEKEHKFPGSYMCRAIGGVETALWDLRGKMAGKPVAELLGGSAGKIRAYASSMKRDITPTDEAERFRRLRGEFGFDAFKFRIGAEVGRNRDEWEGRTEEIIPTIARAVGEGAALLVDANSCYSPERAIHYGKMLQDNGIVHYEEPCPYWELEQTAEVTAALKIDVTGGEQDCWLPTWRRMFELKAVNVAQPDVLYLGGIGRTLQVARMAQAAGLPVTPHAANLGLITLFTMHLLRAIPNAGPYLEFSIEGADYYPWQYGLYRNDPYKVEGGTVEVTDAPGWGVEIAPDWLESASYAVSEVD
ncbi:mandelate racemase/muconate lactonizing enzyme family protein [Vannielia litorea]|uniref:mandelate racemase/muconate lactonizing enzyme family protein n=1 Tax=Vannielia litorea TaxID=1217970 RepID=UPI001C98E08D|nr:mandelate racemase/muconate lactonizing enzyme family protein [Vannielia litorea]MBY6049241.1 mandelate racemase/muconate lactonizing enzyme family protein [Vannielia litorea]MBY6076655.1 mandelate racemase/muconate lactonizing enzyme family protein [Vannielia litorea]